jgi:hypothetical protein
MSSLKLVLKTHRVQDKKVGAPACGRLSTGFLGKSRVQFGVPISPPSHPTFLSCTQTHRVQDRKLRLRGVEEFCRAPKLILRLAKTGA